MFPVLSRASLVLIWILLVATTPLFANDGTTTVRGIKSFSIGIGESDSDSAFGWNEPLIHERLADLLTRSGLPIVAAGAEAVVKWKIRVRKLLDVYYLRVELGIAQNILLQRESGAPVVHFTTTWRELESSLTTLPMLQHQVQSEVLKLAARLVMDFNGNTAAVIVTEIPDDCKNVTTDPTIRAVVQEALKPLATGNEGSVDVQELCLAGLVLKYVVRIRHKHVVRLLGRNHTLYSVDTTIRGELHLKSPQDQSAKICVDGPKLGDGSILGPFCVDAKSIIDKLTSIR